GRSLWEATEFAEEAGVGAAPLRAVQQFRTLIQSLQAGALELPVAQLVERTLERSGYLEALEAERTIEAQGRIENLQELVGVARAKELVTLTHASSRSLWGARGYNLASRFLDELPTSVERERLRPASWSSYGSAGIAPREDVPTLSTGDSVRHSTLGEGVVI